MALNALSASTLSQAHARIHVMRGAAAANISWDALSRWLDDLAGFCGEKLLRVKALVHVTDCEEPILIQGVGTTYSMPRRMTRLHTMPDVLVVITRDITPDEIVRHLSGATVKLSSLSGRPGDLVVGQQVLLSFTPRSTHVLN